MFKVPRERNQGFVYAKPELGISKRNNRLYFWISPFAKNSFNEITWWAWHHHFQKSPVSRCFRPHESKNPAFSNSSGLKSVFEKLRFRDGWVWTVDQTEEIKLRFLNFSAVTQCRSYRKENNLFSLFAQSLSFEIRQNTGVDLNDTTSAEGASIIKGSGAILPVEIFKILTPLKPLSQFSEWYWKSDLTSTKRWKPVWVRVCIGAVSQWSHGQP